MIQALETFIGGAPLDWTPLLTVVFLISSQPWRQYEPAGSLSSLSAKAYLGLLMAALLFPVLISRPVFWFVLVGIHFFWIFSAYWTADNHRYLEGYWCLAIGIALWKGGSEGNRYLALDAQYLIGLCFFFATYWKLRNPSFRNGSFFTESLILDRRLRAIALWIGKISPEVKRKHLTAKRHLVTGRLDLIQVSVPARLRIVALVLTWWTILSEALVAVLFLSPWPELEIWRTLVLVVFVMTTYVLVPVPTFGHILLLMLLVTVQEVSWRMAILGIAVSLLPFTVLARWLEKQAVRRLNARERIIPPLFYWSRRAESRRLEKDGNSYQLLFPQLGFKFYIKSSWAPGIERLLKLESPAARSDLLEMVPEIPEKEWDEMLGMLIAMKILNSQYEN